MLPCIGNIHASDHFTHLSDDMPDISGITPCNVADTVETDLVAKAKNRPRMSPESAILPGQARDMMLTSAMGDDGFVVVRQVGVCPANPERGLPAINGDIGAGCGKGPALFDP
jgi:ornithine cyclodeaminase/alanine dehydrogenase